MKTGSRTAIRVIEVTLGLAGAAVILQAQPSVWGNELDQSIRIRGNKPFGSRVTVQLQLAATDNSIFCRDLSGAPKRRTESIPYPSDLANNHFFFIHDVPRDYCKYRIETLSLEMALNPPDITYRSQPISVWHDSGNPPAGVRLRDLEQVSCRYTQVSSVSCVERVGGGFRQSGSTPFWIHADDFTNATEFVVHFSGR
jgi:hypothetical protein